MSGLQVPFKALKDGAPDVLVKPEKRVKHGAIHDFGSPIEKYLEGGSCLYLSARSAVHLHFKEHDAVSSAPQPLHSVIDDALHTWCRLAGFGRLEADGAFGNAGCTTDGMNLTMLVPVARFVQQPQGMRLEIIPSRVWGQFTYRFLRLIGGNYSGAIFMSWEARALTAPSA